MFTAMTKKQLEKVETILAKMNSLTGITAQEDQQHIIEARKHLFNVYNRHNAVRKTGKLTAVA